jgi:hypothetical protein
VANTTRLNSDAGLAAVRTRTGQSFSPAKLDADVLTDWIVAQVSRLAPSPFSSEVQEVIKTYAPPNPEADRQLRELKLVGGYGLLVIPAVALWAVLAWAASSAGGHEAVEDVLRVGWALIVGLFVGIGLHLIRYYDALISQVRDGRRRRTATREHVPGWPRSSTDADFLLQIVASVVAAIIGAPR